MAKIEDDVYKRVLNRRFSDFQSAVKLNKRRNNIPHVISEQVANQINHHLPSRIKSENLWNLIYSTDQHGISYKTLLENVQDKGPMLIAIRDSNDAVFGAYINQPLEKHPNFYGNGTCFLWKLNKSTTIPEERILQVFHHTKKDNYFILCDPDFLAVGGGDGKFGLWVSADLLNGHSEQCSTFGNDSLCSSGSKTNHSNSADFTVQNMEIWCFM